MYRYLSVLMGLFTLALTWAGTQMPVGAPFAAPSPLLVDDFEAERAGALPEKWTFLSDKTGKSEPAASFMSEREKFFVVDEGDNKVLRAYTHGEAQRISLLNALVTEAGRVAWDLRDHPHLRWDWRALKLPRGANEEDANDTGAALYVTFSFDWLKRPRSIKYTYSSTLPGGTVVSFGRLKVIVAASGKDGYGDWVRVERDVAADYRRVFGKNPPAKPLFLTLWSDSDDTGDVAEVDVDNIVLLPARP